MWHKIIEMKDSQLPSQLEVNQLMSENNVVVLRDCQMTETQLIEFAGRLGEVLQYKVNSSNKMFGGGPITHLRGEAKSVMSQGRHMLPLHNDGVVFKQRIDYLLLYCDYLGEEYPGGDTLIFDQKQSLSELKPETLETLKKIKLEYFLVDKSFHDLVDNKNEWVETFPLMENDDGSLFLSIELPYPDGIPPGWKVRVKDWPEEKSKHFLHELAVHLGQEKYQLRHRWRQNDLLIINNRKTLHSRDPLLENGERHLMRCHIKKKLETVN